MNISEKLKALRKEKGFTQKKLAEISGISENAIKQYESNKRTPRVEQLKLLADALDTTTGYFLDAPTFHPKQIEILDKFINKDNFDVLDFIDECAINVKVYKDSNGVNHSHILSDEEVEKRKNFYLFLSMNKVIDKYISWDEQDNLREKIIPHLKIFLNEIQKDSDK